MYMNMYFHHDGVPDEKRAKIELFVEEKAVGHARFDLGTFYMAESKELVLKNEDKKKVGTCQVLVKILNKSTHPLIDKK